jgi:hypothetical protein
VSVNPKKIRFVIVSFFLTFLALFKRIFISTRPDDETSSLFSEVIKGGRSTIPELNFFSELMHVINHCEVDKTIKE